MSSQTDSHSRLNLEQQRKRAKDLRRAHFEGNLEAAVRILRVLPRARTLSAETVLASPFTLSEAQLVVAREAGFPSWPNLKRHLADAAPGDAGAVESLVDAALNGNDETAVAILARDSAAPRRSLYAAAALADTDAVLALLDADPQSADRPGGRRAWKPLLYLCSSRYRRAELGAARATIAGLLIALGAAVTGREPDFTSTHGAMMSQDNDLFAIEAAAGRSASPDLVRVLLEAGADLKQTTVALLQAVRGGNLEVLNLLLAALPTEVSWQANWALQESVVAGRIDMVRILADRVELPAQGAIREAIQLARDPAMIEILLGGKEPSWRRGSVEHQAYQWAGATEIGRPPRCSAPGVRTPAHLTDVDRMLEACVTGDRAALHALLATTGPLRSFLRDNDHRMLAWAIRTGRYQAVPLMLEAGLDPDVPDNDGETPLHLGVRSGAVATVDVLIRSGASVDEGNFDGQTPLEVALSLSDDEVREQLTRRLLDAGASPARMSRFHSGMHGLPASIEEKLRQGGAIEREDPDFLFERAADAVAFGNLEALREMLDEEPSLVHARSPRQHRATLLHYCGANGVEAPRQRTPPNAPAIARLLLERGAKVNATCNLYRGAATTLGLMFSSVHPIRAGLRTALCEVLLQADSKGAPGPAGLWREAALGRLDSVKRCFHDSGELQGSLAKQQIQSAFMWACDFGRTAVAEFLVDKGADLGAQNQDGQTGLHVAALAGHLDTVKSLLNRQAPLEIENIWGGTVLNHVLWAAINHDPNVDYAPIVEALVRAGANVEPGTLDWWRRQTVLFPPSKTPIEKVLELETGH